MTATQFVRFVPGIPVTAAGLVIPLWFSAIAAVILVALAVWLLRARSEAGSDMKL